MLKDRMAKAQIVAALQGYANDIDRIVALIPLGNGAKEAQSRLKQLKTATHGDYKHRHSIVSSTQLTPQEQANLERSIRDMFFALQAIGVNTNPSPEWRSALFRADLEIERCLAELQDPVKTRVESVVTTDWLQRLALTGSSVVEVRTPDPAFTTREER